MPKFRNKALAERLANTQPKENLVAAIAVPKPDTKNLQGNSAYKVDNFLQLLSMLNTLKLEPQFYRSETEQLNKLRTLVNACVKEDLYLTAQCIVYSRCVGEGMRSINHAAATFLAAHLSGKEWSRRFYNVWDKKSKSGGTIYRPDDISEIVACFTMLNSKSITNAMKKGFKSALESMDTYSLLKYKAVLLDVINLVHPEPNKSKAFVNYEGKKVSVFEAIIKGYNVSADTWEVAQSDAGQEVAKAVKAGKITKTEAVTVLKEAKADNWAGLLSDNKLGILAAVRNIRNILSTVTDTKTIDLLCKLLSDGALIKAGKVMPYQIDMAVEVVNAEFNTTASRKVQQALLAGYESSLPNLAELLVGENLVIIDMSDSMGVRIADPNRKLTYKSSCLDKASLIGATIAKATNSDIIRFGSTAEYIKYNANTDVFSLSKSVRKDMGMTNLASAWQLAARSGKKYTRVFILSDNECNRGSVYNSYKDYLSKAGSPYVYSVDMAAYGTQAIAGPNVRFYYGFGNAMFEDIATSEFNPSYHLDKVRKIVI